MSKVYAFFDFDGTLTERDTLRDFARFYWGRKFWVKMLKFLPAYIAYRMGFITDNHAKKMFVRYFYRGEKHADLIRKGKEYNQQVMPHIENKNMLRRLHWHMQQEHTVVIVSASLSYWLWPWCTQHGISLLCTAAEVCGDSLSGELVGENCHGHEKVRRIQEYIGGQQEGVYIYAYGDTQADYPMLDIADVAYECSDKNNSPYHIAKKEVWYAS